MVASRWPARSNVPGRWATCPRTATTTPPRTSRATWRVASASSNTSSRTPRSSPRLSDGVVGPGSIVTVVYEGDDESAAERYLVGHIEERQGDLDVISPESPLGRALIGARAGEWVTYEAPNGELRVQLLKAETA